MQNDSLETLLLRHYGSSAQTPRNLKKQLCASIRSEVAERRREQRVVAHLRQKRVTRRHAVKLVAMGTAGLGILSVGLEGLQMLEDAFLGQDITQTVSP